MIVVIGLVGHKGTGKDTVAQYLVEKYGFKQFSFASILKDVLSIVFGWSREMLEGTTKESREWREVVDPFWKCSPREALQKVGTDCFRNIIDPDIWVKSVQKQILTGKYERVVISDCRFINEINLIHELKGTLIWVQRINDESKKYIKTTNESTEQQIEKWSKLGHKSEWEFLLDIEKQKHIELSNEYSIQRLYDNIDSIMKDQI